jgi:cell division protein FtsL
MSKKLKETAGQLKPYISLWIVVCSLFVLVFFKMESRRLGSQAVKLNSNLTQVQTEYRNQSILLAKSVRADRIRFYAMSQLTLEQAEKGQIIQMSGDRIALAY